MHARAHALAGSGRRRRGCTTRSDSAWSSRLRRSLARSGYTSTAEPVRPYTYPSSSSRTRTWHSPPLAASVGQFAIQLAALSGYKVATTASPKNFELVNGLGASAVFDYRDPDVVANIKAATHDSVRAALDTISLKETQAISAAVISPEGGKVMHILAVIADATVRTDVERECEFRNIVSQALGSNSPELTRLGSYDHLLCVGPRVYVCDGIPCTRGA